MEQAELATPQTRGRTTKRLALGLVTMVLAMGGLVLAGGPAHALPDPTGEYTPITPHRIMDTRDGSGQPFAGPLGQGESRGLTVTGTEGIPSTGVSAVVVNVTVTGPTYGGYLSVWPTGQARPTVSNLNFSGGQTVPNLVTVKVGAGGSISLFNAFGFTHVIVDAVGFYADATGPAGSRYHPAESHRILDTRFTSPLGEQDVRGLKVDVNDVPTGVTAVALNVTITEPTEDSVLTVYPNDVDRPNVSNLNYLPGTTRANLVTVRVPVGGIVNFWNLRGSVQVIADVVGYYDGVKTTEAGRFVPLTPVRGFDTRTSTGALPPNYVILLNPLGKSSIPPTGVSSVLINLTAVTPTGSGYLTVFPADAPDLPVVSSVNFSAGDTVPNLVIANLSSTEVEGLPVGTFVVYNPQYFVHVVVDVFGYFTGGPGVSIGSGGGTGTSGSLPATDAQQFANRLAPSIR